MIPASPLHLYVHIPFCLHKCPYCDFNSHAHPSPRWEEYLQSLLCELDYWAGQKQFTGRLLETVYLGGGTPSLMPPDHIACLLEHVRNRFKIACEAEISMEANPGAADSAHFTAYHAAGVSRLSIGVQSFNNMELQWLERIHDARDAENTFCTARQAGFGNINLDLMYGLPGQPVETWIASLQKALHLRPEHLSCYQLTIEPHTLLAARHARWPSPLPDDDESLSFFHVTRSLLAAAGYAAYEISNFSRASRQSRHNTGYWVYDDYIGVGAGACGKWDRPDGAVERYANLRTPEHYMTAAGKSGKATSSREVLPPFKAAAEAAWLGLRRTEGVSRRWFRTRFGKDARELFGPALASWQQRGSLEITSDNLRLTAQGVQLADAIAAEILAAAAAAGKKGGT